MPARIQKVRVPMWVWSCEECGKKMQEPSDSEWDVADDVRHHNEIFHGSK